jgi:hypothetical protein
MTTAHTPGPWFVHEIDDGVSYLIGSVGSLDIRAPVSMEDAGSMMADARLIAAAPDLLAVLVAITDEMQVALSSGEPRPAKWFERRILRARAAIKRATD